MSFNDIASTKNSTTRAPVVTSSLPSSSSSGGGVAGSASSAASLDARVTQIADSLKRFQVIFR
jgi:hypothetical protein